MNSMFFTFASEFLLVAVVVLLILLFQLKKQRHGLNLVISSLRKALQKHLLKSLTQSTSGTEVQIDEQPTPTTEDPQQSATTTDSDTTNTADTTTNSEISGPAMVRCLMGYLQAQLEEISDDTGGKSAIKIADEYGLVSIDEQGARKAREMRYKVIWAELTALRHVTSNRLEFDDISFTAMEKLIPLFEDSNDHDSDEKSQQELKKFKQLYLDLMELLKANVDTGRQVNSQIAEITKQFGDSEALLDLLSTLDSSAPQGPDKAAAPITFNNFQSDQLLQGSHSEIENLSVCLDANNQHHQQLKEYFHSRDINSRESEALLDKCRRLEQQLVQARTHVSSVKKELTNADATVSEHMKLAWEFENKCTTVHVLEATLSQINERVEGLTRSNKKLGKERDLSKNQVDELRSRLATIGQNAGADNKSASGNKHMENQLKDLALEFNNLKVDKLALEKQVERDNEVKVQLEESEQAVGRANTAYTMLESYFLEMNAELVQVEENKVKLEELMVKFEKINPGEPEARH